tara:strand:- start:3093 stop:3218 length:126 start_codon:yes stop_codon:yes gene_type:complete
MSLEVILPVVKQWPGSLQTISSGVVCLYSEQKLLLTSGDSD